MKTSALLLLGVAASASVAAFEWRPHNRMAYWGRTLAKATDSNAELRAFLDGYGTEIDNRAGNDNELFKTDEDNTEGVLLRKGGYWYAWCEYQEGMCSLLCSEDHFHPPLALPLPAKDATLHAREYFDMAVRLYKAARCNNKGMGQTYFRWAARALGHAIHLVEDMGSPHHGYPENHMPLAGHGPSFFDLWAQHLWDTKVLWNNPAGGLTWLGQYEVSAAQEASTPLSGSLEGIGVPALRQQRTDDDSWNGPAACSPCIHDSGKRNVRRVVVSALLDPPIPPSTLRFCSSKRTVPHSGRRPNHGSVQRGLQGLGRTSMTRAVAIVLASSALGAAPATSYEWLSHNRMAFEARGPAPRHTVDPQGELNAFLDPVGGTLYDLDTRAGNICDVRKDSCEATDEDHTEGGFSDPRTYSFEERACGVSCTFDHFSPMLPLPLLQEDATDHARPLLLRRT